MNSARPPESRGAQLRQAHLEDAPQFTALFQEVAREMGGLARRAEEIDEAYLRAALKAAATRGCALVIEAEGALLGGIFTYAPEPALFHRCWSNTTLAVTPKAQGQGLGRRLMEGVLAAGREATPPIDRLELFVRASNVSAQGLYERLGFRQEGVLKQRLRTPGGALEDDQLWAYYYP